MMKKCYICKEIKEISEFYNDKSQSGGKSYECKKCKSEIRKKQRLSNVDKYREQQRKSLERNYDSIRASQKRHLEKNRDKILKRRRENRLNKRDEINKKESLRRKNDPLYYIKERKRQKAWREKNKEKLKNKTDTHKLVMYAVKLGILSKPKECSKCGQMKRIEGHHEDYSKPLEVIWLCNPCHQALHKTKKIIFKLD